MGKPVRVQPYKGKVVPNRVKAAADVRFKPGPPMQKPQILEDFSKRAQERFGLNDQQRSDLHDMMDDSMRYMNQQNEQLRLQNVYLKQKIQKLEAKAPAKKRGRPRKKP